MEAFTPFPTAISENSSSKSRQSLSLSYSQPLLYHHLAILTFPSSIVNPPYTPSSFLIGAIHICSATWYLLRFPLPPHLSAVQLPLHVRILPRFRRHPPAYLTPSTAPNSATSRHFQTTLSTPHELLFTSCSSRLFETTSYKHKLEPAKTLFKDTVLSTQRRTHSSPDDLCCSEPTRNPPLA